MEKERERNISGWLPLVLLLLGTWPITQAHALTGNRTGDPLVCRPTLNPLGHTSQGKGTVLIGQNRDTLVGRSCTVPFGKPQCY